MAKKLNKVFLNPTAEQIAEYELIEGISWFVDMDTLADAIEEDQKKKAAERVYSLKNFQIIDGARDLTANLTKIAKQTGFTLSNDLSKVLDRAKTEIDYDVEYVTDHRVASATADGAAELTDFKRGIKEAEVTFTRAPYGATAAGQEAYEEDIETAKEMFDGAGSPVDTKVIGYKDLTLTNVGSKATSAEEGETFAEKKTVVTPYSAITVEGGDFSFDYQKDSVKAVDKKDIFLVTETGKETAKVTTAASGTLTVTDSVIGGVGSSFAENAAEIKALHKNPSATQLVDDTALNAGAYETVVVDNTTVQGDIKGGKTSYDASVTFKNETFLDKPEESGEYYSVVSTETDLAITSANRQIYLAANATSALTEAEAKALTDEGLSVVAASEHDNIQVNKYELVSYDLEDNPIPSGSFVYLSADEFANLAASSRKALGFVAIENNVGWADYSPERVVTDDNFQTFTTAPAGAAAADNVVNQYVFADKVDPAKTVTYYLTAAEAADVAILTAIDAAGYNNVPVSSIVDGRFRRVAAAVDDTTYATEAKDAYSTVSTTYKNYAVSTSMSEEAALELNKVTIPEGFAWIKTPAAADDKALFAMSKFTKTGDASVETKYYLSASEMSAMGFFGDGVNKSFDEVKALVFTDLKLEGWAFTDNTPAGDDRVYTNGNGDTMYREGVAATAETLANYTTDKTEVVTDTVPYAYNRCELSYTTDNTVPNLLSDITTPAQFTALVNNNLVGANSEYVTVIDGQTVNMYQIYGYGPEVNNPTVTVTTDKFTLNSAEIFYDGAVQEALWEGDPKVVDPTIVGGATLVDGVKTQNTKKYFDQFASLTGEYVSATKAEEELGEKEHKFITVADQRYRDNNAGGIGYGHIVTDVQAKAWDAVGEKWVAGYLDRDGNLTTDAQSAANLNVKYYQGTDDEIYALTDTEAGLAAPLLNFAGAQVFYYTSVTGGGAWFDTDVNATAWKADAVKAAVQPPTKRDFAVAEIGAIATLADIAAVKYTDLTAHDQLTNDANWTYQKAYVTEQYNTADWGSDQYHNYDRVQIEGQDAFIEAVSGTLVTDAKTSYDAIYKWELQSAGNSVDGLAYFMTEAEKAKVKFASGVYPADTAFVKIGTDPVVDSGNSQYRISNLGEGGEGLDKSAYLSYNKKDNAQGGAATTAKLTVDNDEAYFCIDYVFGKQVYKYTLEGDNAVYYLTEGEAGLIGAGWGGALTQGDAVEGVVHYGWAADYGVAKKADFTKTGTVYYFTDSYSGDCITQDAEGKAVQAFNADGEIWSNIDNTPWTVDGNPTILSNYASELCENTYAYTYDNKVPWTAEQIDEIKAAEEAAGIATWKVEDIDGQIVWTRTSAIGEVSTYAMDHEGVVLELKSQDKSSKEATGSIDVINGSEVKGGITGYLDVTVTDSSVQDVYGGKSTETESLTKSTNKGAIAKDDTRKITVKENEKIERTVTGAGSFTISRSNPDDIYTDAGDVQGYETVSVTGVNMGDLTVSNEKQTIDAAKQTTFAGDADALRSNYLEKWATLAFTKGIVSKIDSITEKQKRTQASMGSAEITGRDYEYVPGTGMATYNWVGDISGYKQVTLSNVETGDISATDGTGELQISYKLTNKKGVDSAAESLKRKTDEKAVAELTAVNDVTNPELEQDLWIGDITGFKTVTVENYSFGDADAVGDKTVTTSDSSVIEAVASDMRLVNAGVDPNTGLLTEVPLQRYIYGGTSFATDGVTYANKDMSFSSDSSTKRTANGTLEATGRAFTVVTENYVEIPGVVDPVFAYTQTSTGRTVYLTEAQFDAFQTESKADAAQWTKGTETVYYRNSGEAVNFGGAVTGFQTVFECKNAGDTITFFLTEGELANYNLVNSGDKLTKGATATLRVAGANVDFFAATIGAVAGDSGAVGTLAGVWHYKKAGEADQFLTEAEAAALGEGWAKDTVDTAEYVRKANAGDDRTVASVIDKTTMTGDLKVYQNKYDSSLIYVLDADEEAFIKDTSATLDDYELSDVKGYRVTGLTAGISADLTGVSAVAEYAAAITEAHSYVEPNAFGEIIAQVYVTDAEYGLMHAAGKALENYVLDDGSHKPVPLFAPAYLEAKTQYQFRNAGFTVTADTTIGDLGLNTAVIGPNELYGWALTDEQAAAADVYADNEKSEFVLSAVTEDPWKGNTRFGNIYGYKDVTLTGMVGGNIFRVAEFGAVAADNETSKQTYKKTVAKGTGKNKGKTTYTENDSTKTSKTWTAAGSISLTDSKVGDIAGYKTVEVLTDEGTAEVGQISRTEQGTSWDKDTYDETNKVVTEDSAATFKVTHTTQSKSTRSASAAGNVDLIGQRAGKALVLDDTVTYDTMAEALDAAQAAIDEYDGKQFADITITGGVVGYQNVTIENVTITADGVNFIGGKESRSLTESHTEVTITDNNNDTVKVTNKINDSDNYTWSATGSFTATNVNYADPDGYVADYTEIATAINPGEDYTKVNEYVFNGVTYALTTAEKAALLPYGDVKQKTSTTFYTDVLRANDSITVPAVELTGTLQDVVKAKGVQASGLGGFDQNTVYFAAKAKDGAGTAVDLYIDADLANELIAGQIADLDNVGKYFTEATVDTSKKFYANGFNNYWKKADFEVPGVQLTADVKKYVVTADDKATTYYLTDAEANVMKNIAGMDVAAGSDTTAYTRMTSVGQAVTVNGAAIAAVDAAATEVYEFRGVKKNTGVSISYYLTDAEATACLVGDDFKSFGKVGTTKYFRDTVAVTPADFETNAVEANVRYEVLEYSDGVNPSVYLTEAEFGQIKAIDPAYADYAKVGATKFYRAAKNAFNIADQDTLNAQFTSVNESAEVFEVTNNLTAEVLGYLTRAEILALKAETDFDDNYTVGGTTYLRAADDTTAITQFNGFDGGYVIAQGADLSAAVYAAAVDELTPVTVLPVTSGFLNVTLTNSAMGDFYGGNESEKTTEKLAAKKNSTIATYTVTEKNAYNAAGSLTATDSSIGDATGFDKVTLTASKMDVTKYFAGNILGGKTTEDEKTVYTSVLREFEADYSTPALVIEYTRTTTEKETASGSATLENVVAGDITKYKDVTVSFEEAIDKDAPWKNRVGGIYGGNEDEKETETYANVDLGSYSETTTKRTLTSIGTATLTNVAVTGQVCGYLTANVTDSIIGGDLEGGTQVRTTTEVDVNGLPGSTITEFTVTAAGKATLEASEVLGDISQFKDVALTGGAIVNGSIIVGGDDNDTPVRAATENIACNAVFFTDSLTGIKQVVYLTAAEYKVFATKETTAMIDTAVSVYRNSALYPALTDADLKDAVTATAAMKGYTAYTDEPVTDGGFGQEGKNSVIWTVKTAGNSLTIDEDGAEIGGKVSGYAKVEVAGDSFFAEGFFGTAKADKLTVEAGLATFTTVVPGENPVGFDFGEGKDELVLNGTIGIQAAFKYDEEAGTNAWNLEKVSGEGTIVCRTADVEDVKAAFEGIQVVGTENYNAVTALSYQEFDEAKNVLNTLDIDEWLGFCDKADYFENDLAAEAILSFKGDSVTSGDIVAQISVDGGDTWTSVKDGDKIADGAVVRIAQLQTSTKASNDYVIAFK